MIRLELNGWNAHIGFSASHLIPKHDKCGRLHGHNYAINARIEGKKTSQGLVFDFLTLKKGLRKIADDLDHRTLIAKGGNTFEERGGEVEVTVGEKRYVFPRDDVVLLDIGHSTTEDLAKYVLDRFIKDNNIPENIEVVEIGVDESLGQGAWARREL
ncbi:MAG: 6-carboxytetrahydropterin synthase [Thermoplasmata archaeon]